MGRGNLVHEGWEREGKGCQAEKGGVLRQGSPGKGAEGVHRASQLKERQEEGCSGNKLEALFPTGSRASLRTCVEQGTT